MSEGKWRGKSDDEGLGSLAQSARSTSLKQARGILIAVGVLTLLVNGFFFLNAENEVKQVIDQAYAEIFQAEVVSNRRYALLRGCRATNYVTTRWPHCSMDILGLWNAGNYI